MMLNNLVILMLIIFSFNDSQAKVTKPKLDSEQKINLNQSIYDSQNQFNYDFKSYMDLVTKNHPDILAAELEAKIVAAKTLEAQGDFDPSLNSNTAVKRFNSSSDLGQEQNAFLSNNSLDWKNSYGANFSFGADFAAGDLKTPVSPTGSGGEYFFRIQIPLLRNAVYNAANVKLKSQKLSELIASYSLYRRKLQVLDEAAKAYWSLAAAKDILTVEANLLALAIKQLEYVDEQVRVGNMPVIAQTETQTEIAKRKLKVVQAERDFQKAVIQISKFLWDADTKPISIATKIKYIDSLPEAQILSTLDLVNARVVALAQRPEMSIIDNSKDIAELEYKYARNQKLPALDLYLSPGTQLGDDNVALFGEAGFSLSLPLRTRRAQGLEKQAETRLSKLNLDEKQLIQNIFLELDDIASQIRTSYERFLAAKSNLQYSLVLQDAEQTKFDLGDSTLFVVIRRERATAEAQVDLIKSLADYQIAKFKFSLAQGHISS